MIDIAFEVTDEQAGHKLGDALCKGLQGLPAFKDNTIIVTTPIQSDDGRWEVFLNIGWGTPDNNDELTLTSCKTTVNNFDVTDYEIGAKH